MSVFSRAALEESPLADLHTIAGELGLDGYRRQRKADLIDRILETSGGDAGSDGSDSAPEAAVTELEAEDAPKPRRSRRGGRGRTTRDADADADADSDSDSDADEKADAKAEQADEDVAPAKRSRPARARRAPRADRDEDDYSRTPRAPREEREERAPRGDRDRDRAESGRGQDRAESGRGQDREEKEAAGVVELLGNGSGFLRVNPPDASDEDVYISAAQVRRCELVTGDKVSGPVRAPRRSERYPSMVRIDMINERPADEVAEGTHFDDLPSVFPSERFSLGADDPTLKAIEWLTPIGRGSRVTITGAARSGKSEALRLLAGALRDQEGIDLSVVLTGVRHEELGLWTEAGVEAQSAMTPVASPESQAQAIERAVETARRVAARGGNAVVLIDSIDAVHVPAARRALAAARNIADGGSLTVIAVSTVPVGGETTVIALDVALTSTGRFPALDLVASGTLRPELLVGQAGADAIAQAREGALGG